MNKKSRRGREDSSRRKFTLNKKVTYKAGGGKPQNHVPIRRHQHLHSWNPFWIPLFFLCFKPAQSLLKLGVPAQVLFTTFKMKGQFFSDFKTEGFSGCGQVISSG